MFSYKITHLIFGVKVHRMASVSVHTKASSSPRTHPLLELDTGDIFIPPRRTCGVIPFCHNARRIRIQESSIFLEAKPLHPRRASQI